MLKFLALLILILALAGCGARDSQPFIIETAMVDNAWVMPYIHAGEPFTVDVVIYQGALVGGGYSAYHRTDIQMAGHDILITPKVRKFISGQYPHDISKRKIRLSIPGLTPGEYRIVVRDRDRIITIPVQVIRG